MPGDLPLPDVNVLGKETAPTSQWLLAHLEEFSLANVTDTPEF